jgi:hypothetical protein
MKDIIINIYIPQEQYCKSCKGCSRVVQQVQHRCCSLTCLLLGTKKILLQKLRCERGRRKREEKRR